MRISYVHPPIGVVPPRPDDGGDRRGGPLPDRVAPRPRTLHRHPRLADVRQQVAHLQGRGLLGYFVKV